MFVRKYYIYIVLNTNSSKGQIGIIFVSFKHTSQNGKE